MNAQAVDLISPYLAWLRKRSRSKETVDFRQRVLTQFDRDLPFGLARANAVELEACLYRDGWSVGTRSSYYTILSNFYAWAFDPRDLWLDGENPMLWMPGRPRPPRGEARPFEDSILRRILTECDDPYRRWALIAAKQALRCCEIAGLDREHVTEAKLYVARGKGGRPRWHDTDPEVWEAVRDLPPGPLAVDPRTGERATARYVSLYSAMHIRRRLGIARGGLHQARHWLGVTAQAQGRDIRVVQEMLGHASLSSTQIYTRATVEQQRATRALLPRLGG